MKRVLATSFACTFCTLALAADLPSRQPPPPEPPPVFSWTGFYMGGQVGYAFGHDATSYTPAGFGSTSPDGVIGGVHAGYDWQVPGPTAQGIVVGLEGDIELSSFHGGSGLAGPGPLTGGTADARAEVFGSLRGRLGYAIDRVLIYATGGLAFTSFRNQTWSTAGVDGDWVDKGGWTVGGGAEYAIDPHWSVRAEYRFDDYGGFGENLANSAGGIYDARHRETVQRVEAGFSYRFSSSGPEAVPAAEK